MIKNCTVINYKHVILKEISIRKIGPFIIGSYGTRDLQSEYTVKELIN